MNNGWWIPLRRTLINFFESMHLRFCDAVDPFFKFQYVNPKINKLVVLFMSL